MEKGILNYPPQIKFGIAPPPTLRRSDSWQGGQGWGRSPPSARACAGCIPGTRSRWGTGRGEGYRPEMI